LNWRGGKKKGENTKRKLPKMRDGQSTGEKLETKSPAQKTLLDLEKRLGVGVREKAEY